MIPLRFEWDRATASANFEKHGVSFAEAKSAFADDHALLLDDPITRGPKIGSSSLA